MALWHTISLVDLLAVSLAILLLLKIFQRTFREKLGPTRLNGPRADSWLLGCTKTLNGKGWDDTMQNWCSEFGLVFNIPWLLGRRCLVVSDPKGLAHVLGKDTYGYIHGQLGKQILNAMIGPGVLTVEGDVHKRQRKALAPAFSNSALRTLTPIFFHTSHKLKSAWDNIISSSSDGTATIEVQSWMNRVSFDSVGLASFSHDFGTLEGKKPPIFQAIEAFGSGDQPLVSTALFIIFPMPRFIVDRSSSFTRLKALRSSLASIADEMLQVSRNEKAVGADISEKSVIGLLLEAEREETKTAMSSDEVLAQMNTLLLAGYETTSTSLTWALIELSRNAGKQSKLREELLEAGPSDPSWEDLSSKLPYLDAVVHETLRLHASVHQTQRVASEDDVIPLKTPIKTKTGERVNHVTVAKGDTILVPIKTIHRMDTYWGEDALEFRPERWLEEDVHVKAKDFQGHRHLLTFIDGPRMCIGKGFAVMEFKAVLAVLIRNYIFEFPGGADTKLTVHHSLVQRPKVVGETGPSVPLKVQRVTS